MSLDSQVGEEGRRRGSEKNDARLGWATLPCDAMRCDDAAAARPLKCVGLGRPISADKTRARGWGSAFSGGGVLDGESKSVSGRTPSVLDYLEKD